MMAKKVAIIALAICSASITKTKLITFTNPAIHSLDGVAYMIDGVAIHDMLVVIKKATEMHYGRRTGINHIGSYEFNGELCSIEQLAKIESTNPNNLELLDLLNKSKKDFIKITSNFVDGIETAKSLILELMDEFCERRDKPNSIILTWANARPGGEAEVFSGAIKSFKEFDEFLGDLSLFLKDLVHSCPKAQKQYKEWYKKQKLSKEQ